MHSSEDYSTLEEVDEHFCKKISLIKECIELKSIDHGTASVFQGLETSVVELRKIFHQIRIELRGGHNQLEELKGFLNTMESLNSKLDHMQQNFPDVLKPQSTIPPNRGKIEASTTPVVSKKAKIPAKIACLTMAEFESAPPYMKGRLQYEQINNFIHSFNLVITTKYKLLLVPRKTLKPAEYKTYNLMKSQENEQTKGKYFCTAENLKEYGNIKMDKSTDNMLTILRHCKRIKEVRGPGSFKRYVIIS